MLRPAGIIQRIARQPSIHLEYLKVDKPEITDPEQLIWSDDKADALFFDDYHDADDRAKQLGGRPIFAMVQEARVPTIERDLLVTADGVTEIHDQAGRYRMYRPKHRLPAAYPNL